MQDIIDDFRNPNEIRKNDIFFNTLLWIFVTVLVIGIIFKILHWPGANIMIFGSVYMLSGFLIALLIRRKNKWLFKGFLFALIVLVHVFLINQWYSFSSLKLVEMALTFFIISFLLGLAILKK
jgi:uncharacterized membrane protein YeiB